MKFTLLIFAIGLLIFGFLSFPGANETWDTLRFATTRGYYYTVGGRVFSIFLWSGIFFIAFFQEVISEKIFRSRVKKRNKELIETKAKEEELKKRKETDLLMKLKAINIEFNEDDPYYKNEFIYNKYIYFQTNGYNLTDIKTGDDVYKLLRLEEQLIKNGINYDKHKSYKENHLNFIKHEKYKTGFEKLRKKLIEVFGQDTSNIDIDIDSFLINNSESTIQGKINDLIYLLVKVEIERTLKKYPIVFRSEHFITFDKGTHKESVMAHDIKDKYNLEGNYIIEKYKEDKSKHHYYKRLFFKDIFD
jgi:hypothetical protein